MKINSGKWYYCNLKTNPKIPLGDGDLLIFPGDVGHISQVNCKGSANSIETCSMTDANAQNDGLVRTHPITDYRNRPDAVWKYLPSVDVINLGGCFASQETYNAANP